MSVVSGALLIRHAPAPTPSNGVYALLIVATSQSSAPSIGIDFNPEWVRVSLTPVGRAMTASGSARASPWAYAYGVSLADMILLPVTTIRSQMAWSSSAFAPVQLQLINCLGRAHVWTAGRRVRDRSRPEGPRAKNVLAANVCALEHLNLRDNPADA